MVALFYCPDRKTIELFLTAELLAGSAHERVKIGASKNLRSFRAEENTRPEQIRETVRGPNFPEMPPRFPKVSQFKNVEVL